MGGLPLGFILQDKYTLNVKFSGSNEIFKKKSNNLEKLRERITSLQEKICISFALSITHTIPIGTTHHWTLYFNPLYSGLDISWRSYINLPNNSYFFEQEQSEQIKSWACKINHKNDKLRIVFGQLSLL